MILPTQIQRLLLLKNYFVFNICYIENKTAHITLITKTNFNTKVTEIENEVASTIQFVK